MVIKVLISGISASKEIKKHQQRAQMLLDSLKIRYETIDISEPGHEEEKVLMRTVCKKRNNNPTAHPPQFFNEEQYCGDYEDLSLASDEDTVLSFLKLEEDITIENGDLSSSEGMNDQIDSNDTLLNGDQSPQQDTDQVVDEVTDEVTDEMTSVEERLTLNGQVIDIPADKIFELKGHKINLNDLLNKTEKIEESHTIVPKPSDSNDDNNDTNTDNEDTNENQMNVEKEVEETEPNDRSDKGSEEENGDIDEE